jgi:spore coat polysaccharide biosynthesis protein SpsF
MATTAAIIQARMNSNRLPGKVLMKLGGVSVLEQVLLRAKAMRRADVICVATTDHRVDDPIAELGSQCGVHMTRGSESDVLARYVKAAREIDADHIVRITSDCPLIDPAVCDALIGYGLEHHLDLASVDNAHGWPHGLDCEVFTRELLERCGSTATTNYDREHVTSWMYKYGGSIGVMPGPNGEAAEQRWVLDYPEDYAYLARLFHLLPSAPAILCWHDVLRIANAHPELIPINAKWRTIRAGTDLGG